MQIKGIQMTLFEYFQDAECFSLKEAVACVEQVKNVKEPSIRARIYEGIEKGLFTRVSKGIYTVTKAHDGEEVTCMLIQGNGRDLSFLKDNSIDAIITDHAYDLKKSLKGGNRDFASYACFQYTQEDFDEKYRVLDQFAGSFALGEAALLSDRNAICVEISEEYFEKGKERLLAVEGKSR